MGRFLGGLETVVVLHDYNCEMFKQHNGACNLHVCIRKHKCQMQRGHLLDLVLNDGLALMRKKKISLISGLTICAVVFLQLALLEIFYSAHRLIDFILL